MSIHWTSYCKKAKYRQPGTCALVTSSLWQNKPTTHCTKQPCFYIEGGRCRLYCSSLSCEAGTPSNVSYLPYIFRQVDAQMSSEFSNICFNFFISDIDWLFCKMHKLISNLKSKDAQQCMLENPEMVEYSHDLNTNKKICTV